MELDEITEKVIDCAYTVSNELGCGFLEKIYENALAYEIKKSGLEVEQQFGINVYYDGVLMGQYVADLMVENQVLVELKAIKELDEVHFAQCLNYLKATGLKICLLINFSQQKVKVKRIVHNYP